MENLLRNVLLMGGLAATVVAYPQVKVDKKPYADYQPLGKVDARLGVLSAKSAAQRPDHVNNGQSKFFPPVFNQAGGSCGSASRICYMFTHELNSYRDLNGSLPENYYPSHFSWLLTNGNSGKDAFVANIGIPSAAIYGGQTYSKYFGNQDTADDDFGWMQGYDKWFSAMHNRMEWPASFPKDVSSEEGREAVRQYLWNHSGDSDFHGGGIVGIGVASAVDLGDIPSTSANDEAKVTGKKFIKAWGTAVDHAMTIVGYDDRIEFDLNGNGVYGEKSADEVGAWIIVNSWGSGWANGGFVYCPYAYGGAYSKEVNGQKVFDTNSWWTPEIYHVRKGYSPLRTIKLKMDYSRRSELYLTAGVSTNLNATSPDKTIAFDHFKYAGDGNYGNTVPAPEVPMLGRWTDGLHSEPMEFGYDLTDLSDQFDKNRPLKYFFVIETKKTAQGQGKIHEASIIDYEDNQAGVETPFDLQGGQGVSVQNAGNKTIVSVVVQGPGYYAPQNITATGGQLSWQSPLRSAHELTGYEVYAGDSKVATLGSDATSYSLPSGQTGNYSVRAVYGNHRSSAVTAVVADADPATNRVLQLSGSGFSIEDVFQSKYDNATIEYWLRPASLVSWNQSGGPGWGQFMFHSDYNGSFTAGWDQSNRLTTAASVLKVNQWTHIAIVTKGNTMKVYINGKEAGSVTSQTYSGLGGFGTFSFRSGGTYDESNGSIDELRIWKTARTAQQIADNMKLSFADAGLPADLIAYYKGDLINDGGQTKLRDRVAGNHAEFLNTKYKSSETPALELTTPTELSVSIDKPSEEVVAGIPTTFTATASAAAARLVWKAEGADSKDVEAKSAAFTFSSTGEKKVTVTAYDSEGNKTENVLTVDVKEAPAPVADFAPTKTTVPMGATVSFIAQKPQMGYIYEWSMPGAETETANTTNAAATYKQAGTYKVKLTVTSPDGRKVSAEKNVIVEQVVPQADFDVAPAVIVKGETTFLHDKSLYHPTKWQWVLQGKAKTYIVNGQNSSLVVNDPGSYDVTLKASNEKGNGSTTRKGALIVCNADSKQGLNFTSGSETVTMSKVPLTAGNTEFTIDWWMKPSALNGELNGIGDSQDKFSIFTTSQGLLVLKMKDAQGNDNSSFTAENFVKPHEWHHYAIAFKSGVVSFFCDGEYASGYRLPNTSVPELTDFIIGTTKYPMSGMIDELRIWNKKLSQNEIMDYANAPIEDVEKAETNDGLSLYYRFDQSGGDVQDATSNANNGVRTGFGPDGDAWGDSKGVFSLNFSYTSQTDVTADYLKNYQAPFTTDGTSVNPADSKRFLGLAEWKLENQTKEGNVTTGAHVDANKDNYLTITSGWDGFSSLSNHKVFQTITLPAGAYTFTASHGKREVNPDDTYLVAAEGKTLPNTADVAAEALGYIQLESNKFNDSQSLSFILTEEAEVSLGLVSNMTGQNCVTFKKFSLSKQNYELVEADNSLGHELTVDNSGWASLYLNYATVIPAGVKAFVATERSSSSVMLKQIEDGIVPARTGIVVEADPATYVFSPTTATGTATSIFDGTLEDLAISSNKAYYTVNLPGGPASLEMKRFTGVSIPANTAFLAIDPTGAPDAFPINLVRSGMESVQIEPAMDKTVYDLSGRRVTNPTKGVYIIGRKKVIVK